MSTANVEHHRMENRQLEETPNWFKNYQFSTGIPEAPENLNFVGAMRLFDLFESCGAMCMVVVYTYRTYGSQRGVLHRYHMLHCVMGIRFGAKTIVHTHKTARYFYVFSYPFLLE